MGKLVFNVVDVTSSNSHHPRTGYYPPMVASSLVFQKLTMVSSLLSILDKCKDINSRKHPNYVTYSILPSTLSTITMQHKRLKSFNHLPLKSHTKHVHLSLKKVLYIPHKSLINPLIFSHFFYPPSPHITHKAHVDLQKIKPFLS